MPPRKKKPTKKPEKRPVEVKPTAPPEKDEQEEYKSPVQILEAVDLAVASLAVSIGKMQKYNAEAQEGLINNMARMVDHINQQTTVMNDFALQVQKLTRQQNTFGDLGSVMFEMQSHLAEEKEVIRTSKRNLKAQTKEAIHYLDRLRNLLIDFQNYWREE